MNVIELFSGIGAQAKALEKINIDYNISVTCDWDINAIIAYDIIHNGPQIDNFYVKEPIEKIDKLIQSLNISVTGKVPMTDSAKRRMPRNLKDSLLFAIYRTNNLVDIKNINARDLGDNITLMTYSFPCQDLSIAGNWHNNQGGIDRNSGNRSSLLWEVERLLYERREGEFSLPRFLLMENVSAILSPKHNANFMEWQTNLEELGYINKILTLDARNFGVPQMRTRTYMLSILINDLSEEKINAITEHIDQLTEENFGDFYPRNAFYIRDVLKTDYSNQTYLKEARYSNPNKTISRIEIQKDNFEVNEDSYFVHTITTKQDRNPNSGLVNFPIHEEHKMPFRYLTPRECFLLMGFEEKDFQCILNNDFMINKSRNFFTRDKLYRMAGNSICVNVLESIFELVNYLNEIVNQ